MKVELIAYSKPVDGHDAPMCVCERAASVCYNSNPTTTFAIAKSCAKSGHMSVLEHISFTFHISEVSRALLAQLSRHRHISLSVRSQRYCDEGGAEYVVPDFDGDMVVKRSYYGATSLASRAYSALRVAGCTAEDARYVLPNACHTELYMTANARSLVEMSRLRLCNRAQWEIRKLFETIKDVILPVCPEVAELMRPKCEADPDHPFCTEEKCCGKHPKLDAVYQSKKKGGTAQ